MLIKLNEQEYRVRCGSNSDERATWIELWQDDVKKITVNSRASKNDKFCRRTGWRICLDKIQQKMFQQINPYMRRTEEERDARYGNWFQYFKEHDKKTFTKFLNNQKRK